MAVPNGLASSGNLIFFILIVGGALQVIQATGAIDIGLKNLIGNLQEKKIAFDCHSPDIWPAVPLFAATSEEFLAFMPLIYGLPGTSPDCCIWYLAHPPSGTAAA